MYATAGVPLFIFCGPLEPSTPDRANQPRPVRPPEHAARYDEGTIRQRSTAKAG